LKAETESEIIAAQDQALQTIMKEKTTNRNRKYTLCQQLDNRPHDSMPNTGKKNST